MDHRETSFESQERVASGCLDQLDITLSDQILELGLSAPLKKSNNCGILMSKASSINQNCNRPKEGCESGTHTTLQPVTSDIPTSTGFRKDVAGRTVVSTSNSLTSYRGISKCSPVLQSQ